MRIERHFRFRQASAVEWERFSFCAAAAAQLPELQFAFSPSADEAAKLLEGDWGALGFAWAWRPDNAVWHTAPDTGRPWPADFFGSIPYRSGNPYGDARVVWEPSRLQGLVSLALLAKHDASCRRRAGDLLEKILESWTRANPYLTGVHYVSAMECALRLIAVCHALDMARDILKRRDETWPALVWMMESHASFIGRRLSRYSSSGNHSIAEGTGLVYAGMLFSKHSRASMWRSVGLEVLEQEASRQILPDGGGIEQALWYQLFVLDLLGLVQALLVSRNEAVPARITDAVERGREFLCTFGREPGELPGIGDSDGGFALSRHLRISFASRGRNTQEVVTFPEAGYTVCRPAGAHGLRVTLDHGALGMPPSCGHGHADALALVLTANGTDLFVDPGTYAYNRGNGWRRYFRSTRAHNTVTVDGLDQAVQRGAFMWSVPYQARIVNAGDGIGEVACRMLMRHDGYKGVDVIHWRGVVVRRNGLVVVWDRLEGKGEHEFELNWHLGSEPAVVSLGQGELLFSNGYCVHVFGGHCTLHTGETDPPLGWRSREYGVKAAIPTLRALYRGKAPHEFVTFVGPNALACGIESELLELRRLQACPENA